MLTTFIASCCARAGSTKVRDLLAAFRSFLPDADRPHWNRSRFLLELTKLGFTVGDVDGAAVVAGLSIAIEYKLKNGKLVRA